MLDQVLDQCICLTFRLFGWHLALPEWKKKHQKFNFSSLHTHSFSLLLLKKCNTESQYKIQSKKRVYGKVYINVHISISPFLIFFPALNFASVVLIIWHLSIHVAQLVSLLL